MYAEQALAEQEACTSASKSLYMLSSLSPSLCPMAILLAELLKMCRLAGNYAPP